MKASWVNGALIAAALSGLAVLAAVAPLFGGVASALARDVGNNCSVACLFGALGAAFAFGASLGESLGESLDAWNAGTAKWKAERAAFDADVAAGRYRPPPPLPANDVDVVY